MVQLIKSFLLSDREAQTFACNIILPLLNNGEIITSPTGQDKLSSIQLSNLFFHRYLIKDFLKLPNKISIRCYL
ncbi:MAG: hypothetical protein ACI9XO_003651 [Paraglaciecola sp.]|jgi:hypothetical protein